MADTTHKRTTRKATATGRRSTSTSTATAARNEVGDADGNDQPLVGGDDTPQKHPIDQIYATLEQLFGVQHQLFAMEFPGRVLDESTYAYDADGVFAQVTKPQPVVEEEFRLVDGLLDVAQVTGGPNGRGLASTFTQVLNQLVPAYTKGEQQYLADKQRIRAWLQEEVTARVEDETLTMSRIELFNALNQRYLEARKDWEDRRITTLEQDIAKAREDGGAALDDYARRLAVEASVEEAELESRFADLVVAGFYHEVREQIARLDIASPAEALEDVKARLRDAAMSSLDESETIYPVQLQPANWFTALDTDFAPVDLLTDPQSLQQELVTKQQQLEDLQTQIQQLTAASTGDPDALRGQVAQAQAAVDAATTALSSQFGTNVVTIVRIYLGTLDPKDATKEGAEEALKLAGVGFIPTDEDWAQLTGGLAKVDAAQTKLTSASRNLADLEARQAAAESTDTRKAVAVLQQRATGLQEQIRQLRELLVSPAGLRAQRELAARADGDEHSTDGEDGDDGGDADQGGATTPAVSLLPANPPAAGNLTDIIIRTDASKQVDGSSLVERGAQTSWHTNLFFGSASGSSASSSSDFASRHTATNTSVEIGMRVMKVTIDRGGWFDPGVLASTGRTYNLDLGAGSDDPSLRIAPGAPAGPFSADDVDTYNRYRFAAFPVAFVVAKDVTIKLSTHEEETDVQQAARSLNQASSGGFLCFSASHAETSTSQSKSFFASASGTDLIVRIPGPQILGWFLEFVAKDESRPYEAMPDDYLPTVGQADTGVDDASTNGHRDADQPRSTTLAAAGTAGDGHQQQA